MIDRAIVVTQTSKNSVHNLSDRVHIGDINQHSGRSVSKCVLLFTHRANCYTLSVIIKSNIDTIRCLEISLRDDTFSINCAAALIGKFTFAPLTVFIRPPRYLCVHCTSIHASAIFFCDSSALFSQIKYISFITQSGTVRVCGI